MYKYFTIVTRQTCHREYQQVVGKYGITNSTCFNFISTMFFYLNLESIELIYYLSSFK